jgi:hypothetical protein
MLVYTVDENNVLSSFNPQNLQFHDIGTLNCPTQATCMGQLGLPQPATPFSMGVDRSAIAWVLYCSGEVFRVDTRNASCTATSFQPNQQGFQVFGMGFVADQPMMAAETLYISGGDMGQIGMGTSHLGKIAFPQMAVTPLGGQVSGWPELTGTGDAQLWAFVPDTSPPKVSQIDKTTGRDIMSFPEPAIDGGMINPPAAWAFAFWGGGFFVFLKRQLDQSTNVYRVNRPDGVLTPAVMNTGRNIVGAGVSTCAPIIGIQK